MKKLVLVFLALCLVVPVAQADSVYSKGDFTVYLPVRDSAQIVTLYDAWKGKGKLGIESKLVEYKKTTLNFGALIKDKIDRELIKGTFFASVDYDFAGIDPDIKKAKLGLWIGRLDEDNKWSTGIKASVPLW